MIELVLAAAALGHTSFSGYLGDGDIGQHGQERDHVALAQQVYRALQSMVSAEQMSIAPC